MFDEKVGMLSKVTEREVRLERRGELIIGVGAGSSRARVTGEVGECASLRYLIFCVTYVSGAYSGIAQGASIV